MKRLFVFFMACQLAAMAYCQSSKVIYSNAMTHFYLTVFVTDTARVYAISETSVPLKNVWRLTDREETQVLKTFAPIDCRGILELLADFAGRAKVGDCADFGEISINMVRVYGIKCIQIKNTKTGVSFNINKKTAINALAEFRAYEREYFNSERYWMPPENQDNINE